MTKPINNTRNLIYGFFILTSILIMHSCSEADAAEPPDNVLFPEIELCQSTFTNVTNKTLGARDGGLAISIIDNALLGGSNILGDTTIAGGTGIESNWDPTLGIIVLGPDEKDNVQADISLFYSPENMDCSKDTVIVIPIKSSNLGVCENKCSGTAIEINHRLFQLSDRFTENKIWINEVGKNYVSGYFKALMKREVWANNMPTGTYVEAFVVGVFTAVGS